MRSFVAVDIPGRVKKKLAALQDELRAKEICKGKFVAPENMHITLKFLGDISEEEVKQVKEKLEFVEKERFEAEIVKLGCFRRKFDVVLFAEVRAPGLFELQKKVDEKLLNMFDRNNRFKAHLTLARVKRVHDEKELERFLGKHTSSKFSVDSFSLYKSDLGPEGPVYKRLMKKRLEQ